MKTFIRNNFFETNSSSSHALTMADSDILDQVFDPYLAREGLIILREGDGGYHSRDYRYATPEGKLAYLVVLACNGDIDVEIPGDEEIDILPLIMGNGLVAPLIDFVRRETGCDVRFMTDDGAISMTETILDLEPMLAEEHTLRRLLRSSESWIDTGSDERPPEKYIDSDLGRQLKFKNAYVERDLDYWFDVTVQDGHAFYQDSDGTMLRGTSGLMFLTSPMRNIVPFDAHITAFHIGYQRDEKRHDLDPAAYAFETYENNLTEFYKNHIRPEFKTGAISITIDPALVPVVRGHPFKWTTAYEFTAKCDRVNLERMQAHVRKYLTPPTKTAGEPQAVEVEAKIAPVAEPQLSRLFITIKYQCGPDGNVVQKVKGQAGSNYSMIETLTNDQRTITLRLGAPGLFGAPAMSSLVTIMKNDGDEMSFLVDYVDDAGRPARTGHKVTMDHLRRIAQVWDHFRDIATRLPENVKTTMARSLDEPEPQTTELLYWCFLIDVALVSDKVAKALDLGPSYSTRYQTLRRLADGKR